MSNTQMKHRVAVFRDAKYDIVAVFQNYGRDDSYAPDDYVRISEWQEFEFKPLTSDAMAEAQMTALSKLREKTVDEFKEKLEYIDAKIENLRALTGPEVA